MSAFKGTPGPWRPSLHSPSGFIYGIEAGPIHDPVKIVKWGGIGRTSSETGQANARLIAAAPDLLEALYVVSECGAPCKVSLYDEEGIEGWRWTHPDGREWEEVGEWCEDPPLHPVARAAIAKATGEQP